MKAKIIHQFADDFVPFASGLLQAVNGLKELHAETFSIAFFVPKRLLHEDFFVVAEFAVQESTVEVEHVDRPVVPRGNRKNASNGREFGNRGECFKVIDAFDLRESFYNEACLVLLDLASGVFLNPENSLAVNDVSIFRSLNDSPSSSLLQGLKFDFDRLVPFGPVRAALAFFQGEWIHALSVGNGSS